MKRSTRTFAFILSVVVLGLCALAIPISADSYDFPAGAAPVNIEIDGERVLDGSAAIINSVTYVPLRAFSELMGAEDIQWNAKTRTATVKKGTLNVYLTDGALYVGANGRYFFTVQKILNINGRLFVPIRALSSVFSADVAWDATTRTAIVTTTGKTLQSGDRFYNSNDLYWLARIISAEAAGEPLEGQIAVGNVVLNRKASPQYPNTIYGVIFDRRGGTQFSPVSMGTIYNTPTQSSIIAAKICLEGYSIDSSMLFFMNPRIATSNWISNNRKFAFTIANHDFYY